MRIDAERLRERVGQLHRGLEAGHQALVAVGAGVGDGVQRAGVLDDAADVVQREVGQACIAVTGEQVLAVLPDRLVHVHAGAVVADDRLGHEGRRLAVGVGHVLDHVLLQLQPVGALHQRAELGADLHLAGAGHFVVMHFDRDAQLLEHQAHLGAHVLEAVDRRHREVAALDGGPVAASCRARIPCRCSRPLLRSRSWRSSPTCRCSSARCRRRRIRAPGRSRRRRRCRCLEVGLGALGQRARVALVGLAVARLEHVAGQEQRRLFEERIDVGRVRVGHQLHVRGFDALPAGDRRAVEGVARR